MSREINQFTGKYDFLSNFYMHEVWYEGMKYPSTEHAYQAAKSVDKAERKKIGEARSPGHAKKLGQQVYLRKDWGSIKVDVMRQLLFEKFKDPKLRQMLRDTGKAKLVEGNTWRDFYWGVCDGRGKNWLGILLMEVRDSINQEAADMEEAIQLEIGNDDI